VQLKRLEFADIEKWGKPGKAWATGAKPRPTNLEEFQNSMRGSRIGVTVPAYVTTSNCADAHNHEAAAPPPSEGAVGIPRASIKAGVPYTIPDFYNDLSACLRVHDSDRRKSKMKLHAQRIGTIQ